MIVVGVDPGKVTGISVVMAPIDRPPVLLDHQLVDYSSVYGVTVADMVKLHAESRAYVGTPLFLVVERFVPERTPRGFDATPIEVIGEIKAELRNRSDWTRLVTAVSWPLRVEKERVSDKVLKRLDLHLRGKELRHINDATRHVVNRLVAAGHRPTMEKGWPA